MSNSFDTPSDKLHVFERDILGQSKLIKDYGPVISGIGDFRYITGLDVVLNSIRQLFLLPKGHYPFDPEFGSDLYRKIFEMGDEISIEQIRKEVFDTVRLYEDRANINDVRIKMDRQRKVVHVELDIIKGDLKSTLSLPITGNDPDYSPFMERL